MKRWMITALVGLASFGLGCWAGWFARGKTEIKFEEVSEEELEAYAQADGEARAQKEEKKEENTSEIPSLVPEKSTAKQIHETIDTNKTEYWAKWQDEAGKYRKNGKLAEGEEPVYTEEELDNLDLEEDLVIDSDEKLPVVQEIDEEEYDDWLATPDGEYSAIELTWFAGDNVVVDDENDPITDPMRNLGFDPKREFAKMNLHKNDMVSIWRKNNVLKCVFQVNRYPATYSKRVYQEEYGGDDDE